MPLRDLMQHFNDLLKQQQEVLPHLPKTYFYWRDEQFFARFGSQNFGNRFIPIIDELSNTVIGYESQLGVQTALGSAIPVDDVFDALSDLDEVVFLDRITRTLQALNFSAVPGHRGTFLSLGIQPRHILGVSSGHGRTFDTILGDCGLATAKVLLHTTVPAPEHFAHFRRALFSYSAFGYRVGVHIKSESDWASYHAWNLIPDYLFLHADVDITVEAQAGPQIIRPRKDSYELLASA
jgi:EAL domain-containing protein (putative c-di-GMP-specific phosphodiesterase class I)